jgi:hypothetical protein
VLGTLAFIVAVLIAGEVTSELVGFLLLAIPVALSIPRWVADALARRRFNEKPLDRRSGAPRRTT